jgi:hypothetical protein
MPECAASGTTLNSGSGDTPVWRAKHPAALVHLSRSLPVIAVMTAPHRLMPNEGGRSDRHRTAATQWLSG